MKKNTRQLAIIAVALAGTVAGCGSSTTTTAATHMQTQASHASSAPPPLTCSTVTSDNSMTVMQVIATLLQDQKSQDASQEQNWVDLVNGSQTSQGEDLAAAAQSLGSYAGTQLAADGSAFASDAQTFLSDESGGLMPGWTQPYDAVRTDIAKLAADCNISYTPPAS